MTGFSQTLGSLVLLAAVAVEGDSEPRTLTLDASKRIAAAAVAEAKANHAAVVIAVVDAGGHLILLERMEDGLPASVNVAIGKARTAALFGRRTGDFEEIIASGRRSMTTLLDFTPLQGGVPILRDGRVIGAVGASGVTAATDEEIAKAGAATVARSQRNNPSNINQPHQQN